MAPLSPIASALLVFLLAWPALASVEGITDSEIRLGMAAAPGCALSTSKAA